MIIENNWADIAIELLGNIGNQDPKISSISKFDDGRQFLSELRSRKIDGLYLLCKQNNSEWLSIYNKVWAIQKTALNDTCKELELLGLCPLVIKGAEHIDALFQGKPISLIFDVDILIPYSEIELTKVALHSIGYRQSVFDDENNQYIDRDLKTIAKMELDHYELAPFSKAIPFDLSVAERELIGESNFYPIRFIDDIPVVIIDIDIHHKVAYDVESEILFSRACKSKTGVGGTLSPEDHLWITCSRYYTEVAQHGKRSLRDLAYITAMLQIENFDWDYVLTVAKEYDIYASLYYLLSFIKSINPRANIPDNILQQLAPTNGKRMRDWGWQLGVLFDRVEPCPY